jgi:hypothetical protein
MRRRGHDWLFWGTHVSGAALFAFVGGGLCSALVVLTAAVLGAR